MKIVSFDSLEMGKQYVGQSKTGWPLLLDEDRELYATYGFERTSWVNMIGPVKLFKYLKLMLTGHLGQPGKDVRQMGGNVLIDPDGIVRMHRKCRDPLDRPSVEEIFSHVGKTIEA